MAAPGHFLLIRLKQDALSTLLDSAMAGFHEVRAPVSLDVQQTDKSGGIRKASVGPISDSVLQLAGSRRR